MCKVLEVSPSGYYAWRKRPASATAQRRRRLTVIIKAIHEESRQNYGSPRVFEELQARGEPCNVKTVARIMRENDIVAKRRRKFKVTTDSNHGLPVTENLLDRQFTVAAPNRAWVCDITYIPTWEGWLYLATVQDLFSRKIVGWSMQQRMTRQLVIDSLEMAVDRRRPKPGLLCHSDRGSQYASDDYQAVLARHGMACSMSRKGDCWDNAVMESFYSTLKTELIYHEIFRTRDEARRAVFEYIEMFYNRIRRHSTLGYLSPADFELAA
jgi:transposase InsO family protein